MITYFEIEFIKSASYWKNWNFTDWIANFLKTWAIIMQTFLGLCKLITGFKGITQLSSIWSCMKSGSSLDHAFEFNDSWLCLQCLFSNNLIGVIRQAWELLITEVSLHNQRSIRTSSINNYKTSGLMHSTSVKFNNRISKRNSHRKNYPSKCQTIPNPNLTGNYHMSH